MFFNHAHIGGLIWWQCTGLLMKFRLHAVDVFVDGHTLASLVGNDPLRVPSNHPVSAIISRINHPTMTEGLMVNIIPGAYPSQSSHLGNGLWHRACHPRDILAHRNHLPHREFQAGPPSAPGPDQGPVGSVFLWKSQSFTNQEEDICRL